MHRRVVAVEHAGGGQQFGAGFHPHQHGAEQRLLAQPALEQVVAAVPVHVEAGDDEAEVELLLWADARLHQAGQAVAGLHRLAVEGQQGPLEQGLLAQPVGDGQGLGDRCQPQARERGQQ
ncbi:hypothetical protein D3C80_1723980 [compost metagenome]